MRGVFLASSRDSNDREPLLGLNMTLLVAFLPVLLIMIIITLPVMSHVVEIGPPAR